jgi:hypothetical protein
MGSSIPHLSFRARPELEGGYWVMWEPEIGLSREATHVTQLSVGPSGERGAFRE